MKSEEQINGALGSLPVDTGVSKFPGMTYEQGLDEALRWVLGEISDDEFAPLTEYCNRKE